MADTSIRDAYKGNNGEKEPSFSLVRTSLDDEVAAVSIAEEAIEMGLAVSARIVPARSLYIWKGEACDITEYQVEFMTVSPCLKQLAALIVRLHPYESPEVIRTPVRCLNKGYSDWVLEGCL